MKRGKKLLEAVMARLVKKGEWRSGMVPEELAGVIRVKRRRCWSNGGSLNLGDLIQTLWVRVSSSSWTEPLEATFVQVDK